MPANEGAAVLVCYFPDADEVEASVKDQMAVIPGALVERVDVPDIDWVARFREGFRAFSFHHFRIVPSWEAPPSAGSGETILVVEPGRAFGTGTHETTRLCLKAIEELSPPPTPRARVVDVGTGTGILAVAASLLGWKRVVGADVDPEALASAALHAALNRVSIGLVRADGARAFASGAFDLVLANLTAPLLLERRAEIADLVAPGGTLVLAGLLLSDLPEVRGSYSPLGRTATETDGEWASLRVSFAP